MKNLLDKKIRSILTVNRNNVGSSLKLPESYKDLLNDDYFQFLTGDINYHEHGGTWIYKNPIGDNL